MGHVNASITTTIRTVILQAYLRLSSATRSAGTSGRAREASYGSQWLTYHRRSRSLSTHSGSCTS
jgi:hypothetical protein